MTSTGGITATGESPHVPTGGTCDLKVRVGQAGKDSVTSLCRLQPRISRHKAEAAAGFPPGGAEETSHHLGPPASCIWGPPGLPTEPPGWGGKGARSHAHLILS